MSTCKPDAATITQRSELWSRVEVVGEDTHFTWMVWVPDGTLGGCCHWFQDEDEARARLEDVKANG